MEINLLNILRKIYGSRGLPFPSKPNFDTGNPIADKFTGDISIPNNSVSNLGTPMFSDNALGLPVFLPAKIDKYELPNPLITISGSKEIVETDIVDVGTVYQKVFTKPYEIKIICTLINADDTFPEDQIQEMKSNVWMPDKVLTLRCALTDIFLQPENNFIVESIDLMDMEGVENCQVIEINGKSNVDFELEIL